jgi:hypothetical protein
MPTSTRYRGDVQTKGGRETRPLQFKMHRMAGQKLTYKQHKSPAFGGAFMLEKGETILRTVNF